MKPYRLDIVRAAIEKTVRSEWSQTLSALVYRIRDFQLAEDALQDAVVAAWERWPQDGVPKQPRAWLYKTAYRKAIDHIRRRENLERKLPEIELHTKSENQDAIPNLDTEIPDERLRLIFTCCHPALEKISSVALTLRAVGGLQTREIARAFLSGEATMAQRLTRAKRKIRDAAIPYRVPTSDLWPERLESVLSVIYFIFNEGHQASNGPRLNRLDLCEEAVRLGRTLHTLAPDEAEAAGLLALMLLHHSRSSTRVDARGCLIPLEDQDRSQWDPQLIAEGDSLLRSTLEKKSVGPYQIQAAISAVHATAPDWNSTDWQQIVGLYRVLYQLQPSPIVKLNEIVAVSMTDGPDAGLALLKEIENDPQLQIYQPYLAVKADLLRRLGRSEAAAHAYQNAIELSTNEAEIKFLESRLKECSRGSGFVEK